MSAFFAGATIAYVFDPAEGRRRRRMLKDRAARLLRRAARTGIGDAEEWTPVT